MFYTKQTTNDLNICRVIDQNTAAFQINTQVLVMHEFLQNDIKLSRSPSAVTAIKNAMMRTGRG